jgi:hypothetical protein
MCIRDRYPDGSEENVFDDKNTITSGMGVGLGLLYAGSGATDITNFQIRYFQLGTKGDTIINTYGVSESALVSALGQDNGIADYHTNAESFLPIDIHEEMAWNGEARPVQTTGDDSNNYLFPVISDNSIKRVDLNSVTYILYIDQSTCNGNTLNEVGLFMKNPLGYDPERSPLVAYRPFTNIEKTNDFSLVFKWTLNF